MAIARFASPVIATSLVLSMPFMAAGLEATADQPSPVQPDPVQPSAKTWSDIQVLGRVVPGNVDYSPLITQGMSRQDFEASRLGELIQVSAFEAPTMFSCNAAIVLRFFGKDGKPTSAKGRSIAVSVARQDDATSIEVPSENPYLVLDLRYKYPQPPLATFCDARHMQVVVLKTDAGRLYLRRSHPWDAYGVDPFGGGLVGVWIPIGIFATNFKTTDDGLQFAAMPVGIGVGSRLWGSDRYYTGFSAILMWSLSSVATSSGSGQSVSLKSAGAGLLVDFGSWLYLTLSYQFVLSKATNEQQPGLMVGVGVGPKFLEVAKGEQKP